jgi:hypothetical protein
VAFGHLARAVPAAGILGDGGGWSMKDNWFSKGLISSLFTRGSGLVFTLPVCLYLCMWSRHNSVYTLLFGQRLKGTQDGEGEGGGGSPGLGVPLISKYDHMSIQIIVT